MCNAWSPDLKNESVGTRYDGTTISGLKKLQRSSNSESLPVWRAGG